MSKETRKFKFEETKKHCVRFEEETAPGKPPIVGTIYVQKWYAGEAKEISVTVEVP